MTMKNLRKSSKVALACTGALLDRPVRIAIVAVGTLIGFGLVYRQWQIENPVDEDGDQ